MKLRINPVHLWVVKDNQPQLRQDIAALFEPETCVPGFSPTPKDFDTAPQCCPICGSTKLTRVISRFSIAKSGTDRIRDLSWIDKDLSRRLRKKAGGKLSPGFRETLDRFESD
jgi:hypothetical protein